MNTFENQGITLGKVLTWIVIGIVAIIVIKLALSLAGFVIGLGFMALFTLGPIILIGWLILKVLRYFSRESGDATA